MAFIWTGFSLNAFFISLNEYLLYHSLGFEMLNDCEVTMKTPSRKMPDAKVEKIDARVWLLPAVIAGGLGYLAYSHIDIFLILFFLSGLVWIQRLSENRLVRRLAISRPSDSICQFARSFPRGTDTWILRAVYEGFSDYLKIDGAPFPVYADDYFRKDLKIDSEDFDNVAIEAARRAGRAMDNTQINPFHGKVKTIRDVVVFLEYQPRLLQETSKERNE